MSTITKELAKLFRKITNSEIDAEGNAHVVLFPADSLLINNARIALASLEAEPVAWAHRLINKRNGVVHPWVYGSAEACPSEGDIFNIEVMPLYTAPPAPVALTSGYSDFEEIWSSSTHPLTQDDEMKDFAWDIWNACRAAMLQSAEPVTTAYKLPPHIFRELVNRLRDTAVKYQGCQQLREQLSRTLQEVIQPAEPQQEVTQALAKGMERYGDAMQKLADSGD